MLGPPDPLGINFEVQHATPTFRQPRTGASASWRWRWSESRKTCDVTPYGMWSTSSGVELDGMTHATKLLESSTIEATVAGSEPNSREAVSVVSWL